VFHRAPEGIDPPIYDSLPARYLYKLLIHVLFALYDVRSLIEYERARVATRVVRPSSIVALVLISYVAGCLTSSEETEERLPHRLLSGERAGTWRFEWQPQESIPCQVLRCMSFGPLLRRAA
jgi:hypothetical protein